MKYNYVIFNFVNPSLSYNWSEDYYVICLKDLEHRSDVIINQVPLQEQSLFLRFLYRIHNLWFLNKFIKIPFKRIWYPMIFKNTFKDNKPICFICLRYPPIDYLKYLKKRYPNCKIVKMFRDLILIQGKRFEVYKKAGVFDLMLSYDENDCKKYGFQPFDEFESKIDVPISRDYPITDVFFAGRAKDRLPRLIKIYDKLEAANVKCHFYITASKKEDRQKRKGIVYASKSLTYAKMLWYSVNSKCILEISRNEAIGYTSRFLEAVLFNKLLITDNDYIKNSRFYNPQYIQIIKSEEDIDPAFIENFDKVDYKYANEFSPIKRLELVDELLTKS